MADKHIRSIAKGISWRAIATMITIMLVFIFTGKWVLAFGVGAVETIAKGFLYYTHERAWDKIRWGKL